MANKNTLKGYFETGDIPNQTQYQELIDSNLNLNESAKDDRLAASNQRKQKMFRLSSQRDHVRGHEFWCVCLHQLCWDA